MENPVVEGLGGVFDFSEKKKIFKPMTTSDLEKKVVALLNPTVFCIVPNVSWGLGLRHECDLLCLDDQERFTEIELKVDKYDLRNDFKKSHGHKSRMISRLVYAVPDYLEEEALRIVPKECGIIVADHKYLTARWLRVSRHNKNRPTEKDIKKFYRLGLIRLWTRSK